MGRGIDAAKHERWRRVFRQWRSDGQSVHSFCEQHGLTESQFWWWKWRLNEPGHSASAMGQPVFVPVTLVERPVSDTAIEIRLANGCRLRDRSGCDRHLLAELVAMLEGRPC